ncbi:MAG: branched-chain amino acid ABC transporter permease [Thermoprotei archaeon]
MFTLLGGVRLRSLELYTIVAAIILLAVVEAFTRNPFYLGVFTLISIYGVLALSWDVLSGLTGYLNFGLAFPFGVGGYIAAVLSTRFGTPPAAAIIVGGVGAVGFGLLTGASSLRLRGHFFIMITLLIPLAAADYLNYALKEDGSIFGVNALVNNAYYIYNASLFIFAAAALVFYVVANSRLGLVLRSIRENEVAAEALGIDTSRFKLAAFTLSNLFAGMIGAVYVFSNGVASPTDFSLLFSALPVFMCALGGMGTIVGPILGSILLEGSIDFLRISYIQDARLLIASVLLLLVLLFFPKGIWGYVKRGG